MIEVPSGRKELHKLKIRCVENILTQLMFSLITERLMYLWRKSLGIFLCLSEHYNIVKI